MNGGTETTLAGPRRCPYCAAEITFRDNIAYARYGTCRNCDDLERAERAVRRSSTGDDLPTMRDELQAATHPAETNYRATCPSCGELAKPRRKRCALCRSALYPAESFLAAMRAGKYSGAKP